MAPAASGLHSIINRSISRAMGITGSFDVALRGMGAASERLQRAAVKTARPEGAGDVGAVADRILAKHELSAAVATIRTADGMVGTLIDIVA